MRARDTSFFYMQVSLVVLTFLALGFVAAGPDTFSLTSFATIDIPEVSLPDIQMPNIDFSRITGAFVASNVGISGWTGPVYTFAGGVAPSSVLSENGYRAELSAAAPSGVLAEGGYSFVSWVTEAVVITAAPVVTGQPAIDSKNPQSPLSIYPETAVRFSVTATPVTGPLSYSWELNGISQASTTSSYTLQTNQQMAATEHTVRVTVTDEGTGGSDFEFWEVNVLNPIFPGQAQISSPRISPQRINEILTFDPSGSYDSADDVNVDGTVTPIEDQLTYIWDYGKRLDPWGDLSISENGVSCVGESRSCDSNYLILGEEVLPGGNPCVCLSSIDLDEKYPVGTILNTEHYIYYESSVEIVDASELNMQTQINRYKSYDSLSACDGWDRLPVYTDGPECDVTLVAVNEEGNSLRDSVTFTLSDALANRPPEIVALAAKANVVEGETITFDASQSYDPDGDDIGFTWNFGDGTSTLGETVTHAYSQAGTYSVTVDVGDGRTTDTSDPISISVTEGVKPVAFTTSPAPGTEARLGGEVLFIGSGTAPPGAAIIEYIWDLGKRTDPWGEVDLVSGFYVCKRLESSTSCPIGGFQTIDGSQDVGVPCSCETPYPYPELNIYPNSVIVLDDDQSFVNSYFSFSECEDYGTTADSTCSVSLTVKDSEGRYSSKRETAMTLYGLPGDTDVDGELTQDDVNEVYGLVTGELDLVDGNPDCDGDDEITVNDYVLLVETLKGAETCRD